jgi:hypothetical protein
MAQTFMRFGEIEIQCCPGRRAAEKRSCKPAGNALY